MPWLPIVVGLATLFAFLRYFPDLLSLPAFALGDQGWVLAADRLLDDGLVPTRDFGYFYGLLTLAIDRIWFAAFGRTPSAAVALLGVGVALLGTGLIRFARAAGIATRGKLVLAAAVPMAVMPYPYPSPLHALEPALLVHALASQARGKLGTALALVTLAAFLKSGLALVYGLVLLVLILGGYAVPGGWKHRLRTLVPSAATAVVIAAALAVRFGVGPLFETLVPLAAARTYAAEGYGFFALEGRRFWLPPDLPAIQYPFYYLLSPAGFWLLATAVLLVAGARRISRLREPIAATVATCAVLHLAFVLFLFGNQWSWMYSSAVLVCGVAAAIPDNRTGTRLTIALTGPAIFGLFATVVPVVPHWAQWSRSEDAAGMYANPDDAAGWRQVRLVAAKDRVMVFAPTGGAAIVFPELDAPRSWFLLRGTMTEPEIERVRGQLRAANWLVVPPADHPGPIDWPEFAAETAPFREVGRAPSFRVLRRTTPARP